MAKQKYINEYVKGDIVDDFFMVKESAVKIGSTGKQYLDITFQDKSGQISGKKWDVSNADCQLMPHDIVYVTGTIDEFLGRPQLRAQKIAREAISETGCEIWDFVKAAPERAEDMYEYIHSTALKIKDTDLKNVVLASLERNREKLLYYPGASKFHHSMFAGLLYHMKRMLQTGEKLCEVYTSLNSDWLLSGIILHDIGKLTEIDASKEGLADGYTFEGKLIGHIVTGVKNIEKLSEEFNLSEEKSIMLQHMILSHHYEPEYGSPKRPLFPEAVALHYIDDLDAKIYDMEDALAVTAPGEFSERVWTLDNINLYKPSFK